MQKNFKVSIRDSRFLNFINGWIVRFEREEHHRIFLGRDASIDFENMGLHPLTPLGTQFIAFVKTFIPKVPKTKVRG